ncbi:ubiquitin-related modifier 1-like [Tigriopus californicus]|uniref:ubiquitin-related modifier 1-like n=1 Tax=Tigriopus californicus TaxID=6832 RepID=UPI0027DA020F|nr:ubiquitin-related modifier 1-like [Tigriopus californicus]
MSASSPSDLSPNRTCGSSPPAQPAQPAAASATLRLQLEFSGGAELLVGHRRQHAVAVDGQRVRNLGDLLLWIKDHLLEERPELFLKDGSVRPGILVLVNEADWELMGQTDYVLADQDQITFISTLHGG